MALLLLEAHPDADADADRVSHGDSVAAPEADGAAAVAHCDAVPVPQSVGICGERLTAGEELALFEGEVQAVARAETVCNWGVALGEPLAERQ